MSVVRGVTRRGACTPLESPGGVPAPVKEISSIYYFITKLCKRNIRIRNLHIETFNPSPWCHGIHEFFFVKSRNILFKISSGHMPLILYIIFYWQMKRIFPLGNIIRGGKDANRTFFIRGSFFLRKKREGDIYIFIRCRILFLYPPPFFNTMPLGIGGEEDLIMSICMCVKYLLYVIVLLTLHFQVV